MFKLSFKEDVCTVEVDAEWLNPAGELPVCIAQPEKVGVQDIANDASRPAACALASAILTARGKQSELGRGFAEKAGLLVFPEYAFGSNDFQCLDGLIRVHTTPLIVLAGFGAVKGTALIALLKHCTPTWYGAADAIDPQAQYNAAWCWIHLGPGQTCCHIFLKNFFEQQLELSLLFSPQEGTHILRVLFRDFVLYPLICADLICNDLNNPRKRILNSLPTISGRCDSTKRVLVAALLYTDKPSHHLWREAINSIVDMHERCAGLITVNQLAAPVEPQAEVNYWRGLTGGFINRQIMKRRPTRALRAVRFVQTDSASGLILRQQLQGVAYGEFRWVSGSDRGLHVWLPKAWRIPVGGNLLEISESPEMQELKLYLVRRKRLICERYPAPVKDLVEKQIAILASETVATTLTPRLWPKLISGVQDPPPTIDVDTMDEKSNCLDSALGVFTAVQELTGATVLEGPPRRGQLICEEKEILVWNAPDQNCFQMRLLLEKSALDYPAERPLIVIGNAQEGHMSACDIVPEKRLSDITESRTEGQYTQSRCRRISWQPLSDFQTFLMDRSTDLAQKRARVGQALSIN